MKDLTPDEDVVLLGLLREIVVADGDYSDAERVEIDALRGEMGLSRFAVAMERAKERFTTRAELKEAARAVERPAARRAILRRLLDVAASDGIAPSEDKPLSWLKSVWPDAL